MRSPHWGHCSYCASIGCLHLRQVIWFMALSQVTGHRERGTVVVSRDDKHLSPVPCDLSPLTQNITTRRIRSEPNYISNLQFDAFNARIVHIRSIGRLQIFEHGRRSVEGDAGVLAGDGRVRQDDRAGPVAADNYVAVLWRVL